MNQKINIGKFQIDNTSPCFIIAEIGVNHNGSLDLAIQSVEEANRIGADCVKFQTFKAEKVITKSAPKAKYQLKVTDNQESQYEMLKKLELDFEGYRVIVDKCRELNIQFLSTPYNREDADFLMELGVDAFKVASGQLVELPFLDYVARFNKPMIISTGMADLAEVYQAVETIRSTGNTNLVVLQCTTNYPSLIEDSNIKAMVNMKNALQVYTGYSDHVPENYACYSAVALGARVIEKHFTLDKSLPGPDHSCSLNSEEFSELIKGIRATEKSLGLGVKTPSVSEIENKPGMRRSITANSFIAKGTVLKEEMFEFKRPASGMEPKLLPQIEGKKAATDIEPDTIITQNLIIW